jgi:chitodextrinase
VLRNGTQVGTSTATSYTDTGLTASTAYTYVVVAIDSAGAASPPSTTASVTTAPPAPTALTVKATSSTTVALTWAAPANAAVASYGVLRNGTQVGTSTATSFTDAGLTASTAYTYAVVAIDAAGATSPPSAAASVTTPAPTPPTAQVVTVEAESGALTAPMAVGSDTKAQGGKYVVQTTGTSVGKDTITVNVTVAGKYAPALRVISPNGSSDSFTVSVDGGAATVWNLGTHTAWSWVTGSTLTLTAGQHKIVVSKRENGARLDTVRLTPVP